MQIRTRHKTHNTPKHTTHTRHTRQEIHTFHTKHKIYTSGDISTNRFHLIERRARINCPGSQLYNLLRPLIHRNFLIQSNLTSLENNEKFWMMLSCFPNCLPLRRVPRDSNSFLSLTITLNISSLTYL